MHFTVPIHGPDTSAIQPQEAGTGGPLSTSSDVEMETDTARHSVVTTSPYIATNDGTHRLTIRWKVDGNVHVKPNYPLIQAIHSLLSLMFQDDDGSFYRWESEDLQMARTISQLTVEQVREFIAPAITPIPSRSQIIFAVRFGFADTPVAWRHRQEVQDTLKLNKVSVGISNSKSTSGELTVAGYILLKHPTMTHRHRYLQYLRQHLPDVTPFFDVDLNRNTPMDQAIPHLVIQRGENHITPVNQALSQFLTGQNTAVYIPRFALVNMPPDKIKSHFAMHSKYVDSLHQYPLALFVSSIDKIRTEYYADGSTIDRSTREWALSLTLSDGITHAQCDVEYGKGSKNPFLLVPKIFAKEAKAALTAYKLSIRSVTHREARLRDHYPDLPEVIHVTPLVQSDLDYIEQMSAADIWKKAPVAIKDPAAQVPKASAKNRGSRTRNKTATQGQWKSLVKRPDLAPSPMTLEDHSVDNAAAFLEPDQVNDSPDQQKAATSLHATASIISHSDGDRESLASTYTNTYVSNRQNAQTTQKLQDLEESLRVHQSQWETHRQLNEDVSARLSTLQNDMNPRIQSLEDKAVLTMGGVDSLNVSMKSLEARQCGHYYAAFQSIKQQA